jgi:hypothetical protein
VAWQRCLRERDLCRNLNREYPPPIIGFMRGFGCLVLMGLTITWATTTLWLRVRPGTTDAARVTVQLAGLVFLGTVVWMDMALLVMI